jgi:hypothetical protein
MKLAIVMIVFLLSTNSLLSIGMKDRSINIENNTEKKELSNINRKIISNNFTINKLIKSIEFKKFMKMNYEKEVIRLLEVAEERDFLKNKRICLMQLKKD